MTDISLQNRRSRRSHVGNMSINVTPLLDILLVLVLIFMMTIQVSHNDVDLNLPKVSTDKNSITSSQEDLVISINNKNEIFIKNERVDNLEIYISSLKENNYDKVVLVSDLTVQYQKIIEVLISLNNLGFTKIKMAYDKK